MPAPVAAPFSLPQLVGYVAFLLGVVSFLQRNDRRLRGMIGVQAFTYAVHFFLLGSTVAAVASLITSTRAWLSLVTRSRVVAVVILAVNLAFGLLTAKNAAGWLPVVATSAGTIAFFWFSGLAMRAILLLSTACWLTNNLLVGSIGGTMLELFIGAVNTTTCYRIWRAARAGAVAAPRPSHAPERA
ncbi:MAG TPA: YgjV family protein [Polyangiaceae bacterium]|nr:YgjV family protein [Polyangiaceae bacterium]